MGSPQYLYFDGARVSAESQMGKELLKWERKPDWTPEKNPFPKMLYRAQHRPDGRRSVGEVLDSVCGGYPGAAEQWTRRCQLTVNNETELQRALENGWRVHPKEALDHLESVDNTASNVTAERHASDLRMSEVAQREAAEADHQTLRQLPVIEQRPIRKRGRPVKVKSESQAAN